MAHEGQITSEIRPLLRAAQPARTPQGGWLPQNTTQKENRLTHLKAASSFYGLETRSHYVADFTTQFPGFNPLNAGIIGKTQATLKLKANQACSAGPGFKAYKMSSYIQSR